MSDKLTYRPIERQKTYELVAERLVDDISSRRLKPGDTLPTERELVQTYGVGRSSVREALRILESRGLIESTGTGTFAVADYLRPLNKSLDVLLSVDAADFRELFEIRRILEVEAAALAASRRTKAELAAMARAIDEMQAGLDSEERFIEADLRFHLLVAGATRNRVVLHLMDAIRTLLQRSLSSSYHIPGSPESAIQMHRLILEAIEAKQPEDARRRMQDHVAQVERDTAKAHR